MKKWIILAILALLPTSSFAQAIPLPTMIICQETSKVMEVLKQYTEEPLLLGDNAAVFSGTGQPQIGQMTLWVNHKDNSYTVIFTPAGVDAMCMVMTGQDLTQLFQLPAEL